MNLQAHAPATALAHVLAVDDDPIILQAIVDYLGQYEFRVTAVADGSAMQAVLANEVVDLVVLDLKLLAEDGMALARRLRDESAIPIIMLTGRREEADRVMGLELGADDYLTKPFSVLELAARVKAIFRRGDSMSKDLSSVKTVLKSGDLHIDLEKRSVRLLVEIEDRLYAANQNADVFVLRASPKLECLATNSIGGEPMNASLAVSDGEIFIRTDQRLWCIGATDRP
jgi:DNA-binding response OmpR family regulator